jgi:hypothetical protein
VNDAIHPLEFDAIAERQAPTHGAPVRVPSVVDDVVDAASSYDLITEIELHDRSNRQLINADDLRACDLRQEQQDEAEQARRYQPSYELTHRSSPFSSRVGGSVSQACIPR